MKLENLNLVELNASEFREIDGGIDPVTVWAAIGVVSTLVFVYDACKEATAGFKAGYNSFQCPPKKC
ncbi:MAG TPA: hypothetical protein PKD85_14825 [Saprospiraceae bacterium]|nr:hypothetical protein [Saprospiraceae bacterium]